MEFLSLETIQALASQYGYLAVFVGILLENLGIPLPGETITIVGGFLAGSGELNYWLVLGSAAMAHWLVPAEKPLHKPRALPKNHPVNAPRNCVVGRALRCIPQSQLPNP